MERFFVNPLVVFEISLRLLFITYKIHSFSITDFNILMVDSCIVRYSDFSVSHWFQYTFLIGGQSIVVCVIWGGCFSNAYHQCPHQA